MQCSSRSGDWPMWMRPTGRKCALCTMDHIHYTIPRRPSSSSRMRVIYHNWSATKHRPHLQSVAEISRHSVLSGDRIRQCEAIKLRDKQAMRIDTELNFKKIRYH